MAMTSTQTSQAIQNNTNALLSKLSQLITASPNALRHPKQLFGQIMGNGSFNDMPLESQQMLKTTEGKRLAHRPGSRPAGHRITPHAPFDARWREMDSADERLAAASRLHQTINKTIYSEQGMAHINQNKDVQAAVAEIQQRHGRARLVIGGQRAPECVDAGSNAFIWDPYYNQGLQRARPEDFSINIDLTANPDLWGDPADQQTMSRLGDNCFNEILIETVPIQAVSRQGDCNSEDIAFAHHYLQAGIAQGSPYSSVVKDATTYRCRRNGLNTWKHASRVLAPGGQLVAHCPGHNCVDRNTVAELIQSAQQSGLQVHRIELSKSTVTPAFSSTTVTLTETLSKATVSVTRDGLLGTRTRTATGPWHWRNDQPLPHFEKLLSMTDSGANQNDIFDSLSLYASKPTAKSL